MPFHCTRMHCTIWAGSQCCKLGRIPVEQACRATGGTTSNRLASCRLLSKHRIDATLWAPARFQEGCPTTALDAFLRSSLFRRSGRLHRHRHEILAATVDLHCAQCPTV